MTLVLSPTPSLISHPYPGLLGPSPPLVFLTSWVQAGREGPQRAEAWKGGAFGIINSEKAAQLSELDPENPLTASGAVDILSTFTMKHLLLVTLTALFCCWVSGECQGPRAPPQPYPILHISLYSGSQEVPTLPGLVSPMPLGSDV